MDDKAVCVVLKDNEVVLTWAQGEVEVHMAIDMIDLTLGWATQHNGEYSGTAVVYLPRGLINELAKIGVKPALAPHEC